MPEFTVRLAQVKIAVRSMHDEVFGLCREYLTTSAPDLLVETTQLDIDHEREKNIIEALTEGIVPVACPDSYLETLAVYRKIATALVNFDTFLMHGAVIAVGDRAWLFTAPSGTGKTTHMRLWLEHIPGSYVVNGDKPLLHVGDEVTAFGTPWAGKEGMQSNTAVRLCGIVILGRGTDNHIERIPFSQALPTLVQQSYRPDEKAKMEKTLGLIGRLGRIVPIYRMRCTMDPEAALVAYEGLAAAGVVGHDITWV